MKSKDLVEPRLAPVTVDQQGPCQPCVPSPKCMNLQNNRVYIDQGINIFASCGGVTGDALRQPVTKSVNQPMGSTAHTREADAPGPADHFFRAFRGPMNFS
jgi:hypothetical protein